MLFDVVWQNQRACQHLRRWHPRRTPGSHRRPPHRGCGSRRRSRARCNPCGSGEGKRMTQGIVRTDASLQLGRHARHEAGTRVAWAVSEPKKRTPTGASGNPRRASTSTPTHWGRRRNRRSVPPDKDHYAVGMSTAQSLVVTQSAVRERCPCSRESGRRLGSSVQIAWSQRLTAQPFERGAAASLDRLASGRRCPPPAGLKGGALKGCSVHGSANHVRFLALIAWLPMSGSPGAPRTRLPRRTGQASVHQSLRSVRESR